MDLRGTRGAHSSGAAAAERPHSPRVPCSPSDMSALRRGTTCTPLIVLVGYPASGERGGMVVIL